MTILVNFDAHEWEVMWEHTCMIVSGLVLSPSLNSKMCVKMYVRLAKSMLQSEYGQLLLTTLQ